EERIKCDRTFLPTELRHRGYRPVLIQNILFQRDNILYRLERLYCESTKTLYEADLPTELEGQRYGSELRAFVIMLYFELRVPQEKILKLLQSQGIVISAGEISNILVHKHLEQFKVEHQAVLKAGLASTSYQHIDDTSMRVNGENHYVMTLCNPYYTSFFTNKRKNRETVSLLLSQLEEPRQSIAGAEAQADIINQDLGDYIKILVSDNAGQFSQLTTHRALCWIHEGRLYEKLTPYLKSHRRMGEKFLTDFWEFYQKLKLYQRQPTREFKSILNHEFDRLFSQRPTYQALADRIALTKQKKQELLLVLDYPVVPLDNNEAERALREYVIKRKISNGTRTAEGTRAWEIFLSLVDTCRKNSVNFYRYVLDRIKQSFQLPPLAAVILETARVALENQPIYSDRHFEEVKLIF
ncbi:IS66 family transposase, partial [Argonema antarcticum]|uniref:IS66 family transposase n=1 Tax=Argonema antarcticum TaxID=2942763 RepID=UPI002011876D